MSETVNKKNTGDERPDIRKDDAGTDKVQILLAALSNGECKGVKGATAYKIAQFAQEKGLV